MASHEEDCQRMTRIRDHIIDGILAMGDAHLNGSRERRICNNAHFRLPGVSGKDLIFALSDMGIAASTASACAAESVEPSHVLTAMGLPASDALSALRIGLSRYNSMEEADYLLECLESILPTLRGGK